MSGRSGGPVLRAGDPGYDDERAGYNLALDGRPYDPGNVFRINHDIPPPAGPQVASEQADRGR